MSEPKFTFTYLTRKDVTTEVGMRSLIGVGNQPRPVSWGNYFSLAGNRGLAVLNMWAENLTEANIRFKLNGTVSALCTDRHVFIDDPRIPDDWYYNKLCFTGSGHPPIEVMAEWYEYKGDPTDEFEQFVDPVEYYAKRGQRYTKSANGYGLISSGDDIRRDLEAKGYGPFKN